MTTWDPSATGERVEELFATGTGPAVIVAPFVKEGPLRRLCDASGGPVDLYTRWLPAEIASGISDLAAFDVIAETGGGVRLHPQVHAKAYVMGDRALVGSSNTTGNGLGFRSPSAVELLVPVDLPCAPVDDLLTFLSHTTSVATEDDRDAVADRAALLGEVFLPSGPPDAAYPDGVAASPLLTFRDPTVAWDYYSKPQQDDTDARLHALLCGLAGLGVPPGITDKRNFVAAVGAGMRQGVAGRVLRECRRLPGHAAIERFRGIMKDAGTEVPEGRADREWRTFCYWAQEFVPEITLRSNQVGF